MKNIFRLYCFSIALLFLGWIAKLHFIFGGDYLFRIGSAGVMVSFVAQLVTKYANTDFRTDTLHSIFVVNSVCLFLVYAGMMLKVAHLLQTQEEKDFMLDYIGIPATVFAALYSFAAPGKWYDAGSGSKEVFLRHIVLPWMLFVFSFLLYAVYSVILTYQDRG